MLELPRLDDTPAKGGPDEPPLRIEVIPLIDRLLPRPPPPVEPWRECEFDDTPVSWPSEGIRPTWRARELELAGGGSIEP